MPLREQKFLHNKSFVKLYGTVENGYIIKVVTMKTVRNSNIVCDDDIEFAHYDNKMSESVARARSKIFEYAMCNNWGFFFTATLDPSKYDRFDLETFHSDLTEWFYSLYRYNAAFTEKIKFLLIPERHKNGAWHMHGLLSGIPLSVLHQFRIGDRMSIQIAKLVRAGRKIYNWEDYQNKFGFCTLEPIQNSQAVAKYVTKYITKDVNETVTDVGAHMYYHSRPLNCAQKIKEGFLCGNTNTLDVPENQYKSFETDYCVISELPYSAELMQQLLDAFV